MDQATPWRRWSRALIVGATLFLAPCLAAEPTGPASSAKSAPSALGPSDPRGPGERDADAPDAEITATGRLSSGEAGPALSDTTRISVVEQHQGAQQVSGGRMAVNRPEAARRIVRVFDFERNLSDPNRAELYDLPRFWDLAIDATPVGGERPGYPRWNRAAIDDTSGFSGESSFRLGTSGGSVAVRLQPGVAPVFPQTQYLVSARVRTEGLTHARARLIARYLDRTNTPIKGSEASSELVAASPGWTLISAQLTGTSAEAAMIQVDLEIVQPEQFTSSELGKHQVWPQDFAAAAWFDDVAIVQLPSVELATDAPGNVVLMPGRPELTVSIRDLTGDDLGAVLTLQDVQGRVIDRQERTLAGGQARWRWKPRVERLGWYRAVLELRVAGRRVGSTAVDLAWMRDEDAWGRSDLAAERRRFGLSLDEPLTDPRSLRGLVRGAGTGVVTVPAWTADSSETSITDTADAIAKAAADWAAEGRLVSASLAQTPLALADAARVEVLSPGRALEQDEKLWGPWMYPLLDRLGQSVARWQVGSPTWSQDLATAPETPERLGTLGGVLSRMVPGAIVAVPTSGEAEPKGDLDTARAMQEHVVTVPPELGVEGVIELASRWLDPSQGTSAASTSADDRTGRVTFALEPMPRGPGPHSQGMDQLVKQALSVWIASAARDGADTPGLTLRQPWRWITRTSGQERPEAQPMPELIAWRTITEQLAGRRVVGPFDAGPGIRAWILGPRGGGASRSGLIIAWRDAPPPSGLSPELEAFLGQSAVRVSDIEGNSRTVEPLAASESAIAALVHRIEIGPSPIFIEDVDVELARLIAGLTISPTVLSSSGLEQELTISMPNPWGTGVSGRVAILEPGGWSSDDERRRDRSWRFAPRTMSFSAAPGEALTLPLGVTFSEVEEAGPRWLVAELELAVGGREYPPIRVRRMFEIALDGVHLDLSARIVGNDVIVEAIVSNRGGDASGPVTMSMGVFAPGRPRERASITDLMPGSSATRRFVFRTSAEALRGQRVSVGVQPVDRPGRLTRSLEIR